MTKKHTPTHIRVLPSPENDLLYIISDSDGNYLTTDDAMHYEIAAKVQTSYNAHDELVAALTHAHAMLMACDGYRVEGGRAAYDQHVEALAKAKGE